MSQLGSAMTGYALTLWLYEETDVKKEAFFETVKGGLLTFFFGTGKGSGASLMMFILGIAGTVSCLAFGKILNKYTFED